MEETKLAFKEAVSFEVWMRDTVKSIHYANNMEMSEAYQRVMNNYLEVKIHESTERRGNSIN
jgi:hypothetical protein